MTSSGDLAGGLACVLMVDAGAGDASRGGGGEFSGDGGGASGAAAKARAGRRLCVLRSRRTRSDVEASSSSSARRNSILSWRVSRAGRVEPSLPRVSSAWALSFSPWTCRSVSSPWRASSASASYDSTLDRRITERERQLTQRFRRFRQRQAFTLTTRVGIGRRCVFVALFVRVNVDRFRSLAPPSTHFRLLLRVRELDSQPTHIIPRRAKLFDPPSLLLFHSRSDHSQRSRQRTLARLGRFGAFPRLPSSALSAARNRPERFPSITSTHVYPCIPFSSPLSPSRAREPSRVARADSPIPKMIPGTLGLSRTHLGVRARELAVRARELGAQRRRAARISRVPSHRFGVRSRRAARSTRIIHRRSRARE